MGEENVANKHPLSRREFLGASATAFLTASALPIRAQSPRPPNLVVILADDLGYGDLSCYSAPPYSTPHIDSLAAEGLRFTDFHSSGPVCSPTRAALLTGRYPQRLGIEGVFRPLQRERPGLPLGEVTLAQRLKQAGYVTGLTGKWHLGYPEAYRPNQRGFDMFRGFLSGNVDYQSHVDGSGVADWWHDNQPVYEPGYLTDLISDHAVRFIKEHSARPFFLLISHGAPHSPYQARGDAAQRSVGHVPVGGASRGDERETYRAMMEALDEGVGQVVEALASQNLTQETIVLFCSDNGAQSPGSNGPLNGAKGGLLEGGHRVPAIAWAPGRIAPGITEATALTMDIFPTLLELADVKPVNDIDGISLTEVLFRGPRAHAPLPERTVFWRTGSDPVERAARSGPWKLHVLNDRAQLFNLKDDLGETNDLAEAHPECVATLKASLNTWEHSFQDVPRIA